jgi:ectoine hydroxylase-related dioxygenase (phytanoyl-CoA dioxygenase family)
MTSLKGWTPALEPITRLSPEQIASYRENGFLALDAITTSEEIARLISVYDTLFARRAGREDGNQFDVVSADDDEAEAGLPQILNPRRYAPELGNTLFEANALQIAQQLLGNDAKFVGDHAIFKPAGSGAATPWHQDEAYWNPDVDAHAIAVWMPLQEATLENGCMQFLPGSQKMEIVPHRSIGGDTRIHGMELDIDIDTSGAVACPLPAGGATIHDARTLHYTGPNRSRVPRRAYILNFATPPTPRTDGRRFPWNERKQTARERRRRESTAGTSTQ